MRKICFIFVFSICFLQSLSADLVLQTDFNSGLSTTNNQIISGGSTYGTGIAFTTGAGAQAWRLENMTISLSTNDLGGPFNSFTGSATAFLYTVNSINSANPSLTYFGQSSTTVGGNSNFTVDGAGQQKTFNFTTFSNTNNSMSLNANTSYYLGINISGSFTTTNGSEFLNWDSLDSGSNTQGGNLGWAPGNSYAVDGDLNNGTTGVNYSTAPTAAGAVQINLNATAVPEPGTWVTFLSAGAIGLVTFWLRKF